VNPLQSASQTCPWTDPNKDGIAQSSEYGTGCSGFPSTTIRYAGANGPNWPYSDEFTAGIERELIKNMRVGVMYYHRTNRDQIGQRNTAATGSAYAPFTITVPNGPGGTLASPKPVTATVYNLLPAFNGLQANIVGNDPFLNTDYNGVEITAQKRFSQRWQMVTGFTVGKNTGGINAAGGQSSTADLNDPNIAAFAKGIVGSDSLYAFRLSGSYRAPYEIQVAGTLVSNTGYPFMSTYSVTRALAAAAGTTLTRASQTIFLSDRGDERYPAVTLIDLRISRIFRFGSRRIEPTFDIFNLGNASTVVGTTLGVGSTYLVPNSIVSPRIMKIGFNVSF
jgi:hypothetical protein